MVDRFGIGAWFTIWKPDSPWIFTPWPHHVQSQRSGTVPANLHTPFQEGYADPGQRPPSDASPHSDPYPVPSLALPQQALAIAAAVAGLGQAVASGKFQLWRSLDPRYAEMRSWRRSPCLQGSGPRVASALSKWEWSPRCAGFSPTPHSWTGRTGPAAGSIHWDVSPGWTQTP